MFRVWLSRSRLLSFFSCRAHCESCHLGEAHVSAHPGAVLRSPAWKLSYPSSQELVARSGSETQREVGLDCSRRIDAVVNP